MEQAISIERRIQELLAHDPLFQVIKETPTEQHFSVHRNLIAAICLHSSYKF